MFSLPPIVPVAHGIAEPIGVDAKMYLLQKQDSVWRGSMDQSLAAED